MFLSSVWNVSHCNKYCFVSHLCGKPDMSHLAFTFLELARSFSLIFLSHLSWTTFVLYCPLRSLRPPPSSLFINFYSSLLWATDNSVIILCRLIESEQHISRVVTACCSGSWSKMDLILQRHLFPGNEAAMLGCNRLREEIRTQRWYAKGQVKKIRFTRFEIMYRRDWAIQ